MKRYKRPSGLPKLNRASGQSVGLGLWVPGIGLHDFDYSSRKTLTLDAALANGYVGEHGQVWENTDSSAMAVVDGSALPMTQAKVHDL